MNSKVEEIMREAIDELNEQRKEGEKLAYSEDLRLMGKSAAIDSMDLVTLTAIIEELAADKFGKNIRIVSDKAFSMERSPFYSVGTLTDFVAGLLSEQE